MTALREVSLDQIRANPFRDIENYGFFRDKLDRLKESMLTTGAWPGGIIVRPTLEPDIYEQAFGHHRLEAVRELKREGKFPEGFKLTVLVENLSDSMMLKMMAAENAEEFGSNFALGTMNAVSAVVRAYGEGRIDLEVPKDKREASGGATYYRRSAPSFLVVGRDASSKIYTADTVAQYLGWLDGDGHATQRVLTALSALELIELGVCKPNAFQGLGQEQARAVVGQAQVVYKARMRELEEKAAEGEKRKAQAEAKKLAAQAVQHSVSALKDGMGVRELKAETSRIRSEAQSLATGKVKDPSSMDISGVLEKVSKGVSGLRGEINGFSDSLTTPMTAYVKGAICDPGAEKKLFQALKDLVGAAESLERLWLKAKERRG